MNKAADASGDTAGRITADKINPMEKSRRGSGEDQCKRGPGKCLFQL